MWSSGQWIVRREVWRGRPWIGMPVLVVDDNDELLVTYLAEGSPFAFPEGEWPGGGHPWRGRRRWTGHGMLMLQRPGDAYAVFHFWEGPRCTFAGWYLNFQSRPTRTHVGFDTLDHEIDIWWPAGGTWRWKDVDALQERVHDGRFTQDEANAIKVGAEQVARGLSREGRWWGDEWIEWRPPPLEVPELPDDWDRI